MAILDIVTLPAEILRAPSKPVERFDEALQRLIDDMLETMYDAPGVGLAAVQVGVPLRLLVLDAAGKDNPPAPMVFINPKLVGHSSEMNTHEEGCLSLPDVEVKIERPARVTVEYLDRTGKGHTLATDGFMATILQHENDHLDGKLIIDFMSRLKRDMIIRKFRKISRTS